MSETIRSTAACGTCGSAVEAGAPFCKVCGARTAGQSVTRLGEAPPSGAVPASGAGSRTPAAEAEKPQVAATIGRRFGAYVIDGVGASIIAAVLVFGLSSALIAGAMSDYSRLNAVLGVIQVLQVLIWLGVGLLIAAFVGRGATPGMRLLGLRVVRFEDGEAPGFGKALGRQLVLGLSGFLIVGPFSPLFDRSGLNRGWHDTASGTWVVDTTGTAASAAPVRSRPVPAETPVRPQTVAAPRPAPTSPTSPTAPAVAPVSAAPPAPAPAPISAAPPVWAQAIPSRTAPPAGPASTPATLAVPSVAPAGLIAGVPGRVEPPRADEEDDATQLRARVGRAVLQFEEGGDEPIGGSVLIGRAPQSRAGETVDRLITPVDAARSISKTHARIDVEDGAVWVTDRGSTNGTRIVDGGDVRDVEPGVRTRVPDGAVVELGSVRARLVRR